MRFAASKNNEADEQEVLFQYLDLLKIPAFAIPNGGRRNPGEAAHMKRCGALFFRAMLAVARLRAHGHDVDGYEDDNYLRIPAEEHLARGMRHDFLYEIGDKEDGDEIEHLVHSCCRHLMALEMKLMELERKESELEALRLEYGYTED